MGEMLIAYMLICGLNGKCDWFHDKTVQPARSVLACQLRLDDMRKRIQKPENITAIYGKIGAFKIKGLHREFCFDKNVTDLNSEMERRYNL